MITVTNNVLSLPIIPEITYKWQFKTDFDPSIAGSESRVIRWGEPRLSLTLSELPLLQEEIDSLKTFFNARNGKKEGFLFKVPDFSKLETNRGQLLLLENNTYQIVSVYSVGNVKTYKPIRFPISGTVKVFANNEEITEGWLVNLLNGQIQFTTVPIGNLTVSCEYYLPFRFDNDEIEALQVSGGVDDLFSYVENPSQSLLLLRERVGNLDPIYQVNGLLLKEVHQPILKSFYNANDFNSIVNDFSYPILPENVRSNRFTTEITAGLSDVEDTVNRVNRTLTRYSSTGLFNNELDYVINYFLTAKGRAISFNSKRFDSDELTYTRVSPDYVTITDIVTISSPDSNNRRYQVFGKYLSKHIDNCNRTRYFRTARPITLLPNESPVNIAVRRNATNGSTWVVAKNNQVATEIDLKDIGGDEGRGGGFTADVGTDNYLNKVLIPEQYTGGFFGISIQYKNKNDNCNGNGENPSFPRGDNFIITDIVEISNTVVGRCLPLVTILTIERKDGVIYRYTSWDSDLIINGETYKSNAGIVPSAVASKSDMSVDNSEVSSYFEEITEVDILSQKFNNAKVTAEIYNIGDTLAPLISLFGGEIGQIKATDIGFTFELRSKSHYLNQAISVKTSDICRHKFCDSKCGLNIENYTLQGFTITEIVPSQFSIKGLKITPAPPGINTPQIIYGNGNFESSIRNGYIQFTSGELTGQKFDIKDTYEVDPEVKLWQSIPLGLAVGDSFNIVYGCAKTAEACKSYNNFANFGGFLSGGNWMIGDDALLSGQ